MKVADAQLEVRTMYMGGLIGQLVSAAVWASSAAFASIYSMKAGIIALFCGGLFIFPLTQLALKIAGKPAALPAHNPLKELAIEVAVIAPLMLPLAGAAALHKIEWFYPAMIIAVGAHYLPFSFLYGMHHFIGLAIALIVSGLVVGIYAPQLAIAAAWLTAVFMAAAAVAGYLVLQREKAAEVG